MILNVFVALRDIFRWQYEIVIVDGGVVVALTLSHFHIITIYYNGQRDGAYA